MSTCIRTSPCLHVASAVVTGEISTSVLQVYLVLAIAKDSPAGRLYSASCKLSELKPASWPVKTQYHNIICRLEYTLAVTDTSYQGFSIVLCVYII